MVSAERMPDFIDQKEMLYNIALALAKIATSLERLEECLIYPENTERPVIGTKDIGRYP